MSTLAHHRSPTRTGHPTAPSTAAPSTAAPSAEAAPSTAPTRHPSEPPARAAHTTFIRPTWRGWIHRIATVVFVPLAALAVALAPTAGTRAAVAIYGLGVGAMLAVSAIYHSGRLSESALGWCKRIDHTTILLAIAGSYTAIAVLGLPSGPATTLVTFTWIAAGIGVGIRMAWLRAPYPVVAAVYLAVGWGALIEWQALVTSLSAGQLALVLGGGIVYSIGAAVYALHRPNPWPATFGYHEVFHALVTLGVATHYLVVIGLVLQAR